MGDLDPGEEWVQAHLTLIPAPPAPTSPPSSKAHPPSHGRETLLGGGPMTPEAAVF